MLNNVKENINTLIDSLTGVLEANKISLRAKVKTQKSLIKLISSDNDYIDREKIQTNLDSLDTEIIQLRKEQSVLKKVIYRQQISLKFLNDEKVEGIEENQI